MVANRYEAVERINKLVEEADAKLQQAAQLAFEYGVPFEHELNAKVDEPEWQSSGCSDYWESSGC